MSRSEQIYGKKLNIEDVKYFYFALLSWWNIINKFEKWGYLDFFYFEGIFQFFGIENFSFFFFGFHVFDFFYLENERKVMNFGSVIGTRFLVRENEKKRKFLIRFWNQIHFSIFWNHENFFIFFCFSCFWFFLNLENRRKVTNFGSVIGTRFLERENKKKKRKFLIRF